MRAVLLTGHGGLEKLEFRDDVPVPSAGPGEVLVRVLASSVNNTDINTRTSWYSEAFRRRICFSSVRMLVTWPTPVGTPQNRR